jgi:hypothetical protein
MCRVPSSTKPNEHARFIDLIHRTTEKNWRQIIRINNTNQTVIRANISHNFSSTVTLGQ